MLAFNHQALAATEQHSEICNFSCSAPHLRSNAKGVAEISNPYPSGDVTNSKWGLSS